MAFSIVLLASLRLSSAVPSLSFLQAGARQPNSNLHREKHAPDELLLTLPTNTGAVPLDDFDMATQSNPVKFYIYNLKDFEPRFKDAKLANCERKGSDYMFLESLVEHENRVFDFNIEDAEVFVVPCLFESYRRCTTTNHAEKPPEALYRMRESNPDDHPEDFEDIPWVKPFDQDTQQCLDKVMATDTWKAKNGTDHMWVVADWAINFGRACESPLFQKMSIGRIEVVTQETALTSNRPLAVEQSRCSFVVPYASDVAYAEKWGQTPSFAEWKQRKHAINFRFEDRQYVLFCKADPCEGAIDATPLRKKSLELAQQFGDEALVAMERVPMDQFLAELHDAKFCLVMRGDTPSTHSFYDALAANCIPILVSDDWEVVAAPFAAGEHGTLQGGITHHQYTMRISEKQFMEDVPGVAKQIRDLLADETKLRNKFSAMQQHRRALLWSAPDSKVSEFVLDSARRCLPHAETGGETE